MDLYKTVCRCIEYLFYSDYFIYGIEKFNETAIALNICQRSHIF